MLDRLDRASPLPLWAQLLGDLHQRLDHDEFEQHFPSELELTEQYGVSRNTVREALRRLRAEGIVLASRGRRPQLNPEIRQPLGGFYSLYESIEAAGLPQQVLVRDQRKTTDPRVSGLLTLPETAELVIVTRLRIAGDAPLAIDTAYFPLAIGEPLLELDLAAGSLYAALSRQAGVRLTTAQETLSATVATPRQADELGIEVGAPLLSIERLGRVGTKAVEWRRTLIRADRFALVAELSNQRNASDPYSAQLTHAMPDARA